jgi:hypothetical protein
MAIVRQAATGQSFIAGTSGVLLINSSSVNTGLTIPIFVFLPNLTTSVSSITDNAGTGNSWSLLQTINGTSCRVELWVTGVGAATVQASPNTDSITINLSASVKFCAWGGEYSGVAALGTHPTNTGSSTTPTINQVLQDANNFAISGLDWTGIATATALSGTLLSTTGTSGGSTSTNVAFAAVQNTSATPATVTDSVTLSASSAWAAISLELRSTTGTKAPVWQMPFLPGFGNGR